MPKRGETMREKIWIVVVVVIVCSGREVSASRPPPSSQTDTPRVEPAALKNKTGPRSAWDVFADQAMDRVVDLMLTHPSKEIRQELVPLIRQKKVDLDFYFKQSDDPADLAGVGYIDDLLTLHLNLLVLFDPRMPEIHKQLALFHNWVHIRQQRSGAYPKWLATDETPPPLSRRQMSDVLRSELEAVAAECDLAIAIKQAQARRECVEYQLHGLPMLRKRVAEGMAERHPYSVQRELLLDIARESR